MSSSSGVIDIVWVWLITKIDDKICPMTLQVRHMAVSSREISSSSILVALYISTLQLFFLFVELVNLQGLNQAIHYKGEFCMGDGTILLGPSQVSALWNSEVSAFQGVCLVSPWRWHSGPSKVSSL